MYTVYFCYCAEQPKKIYAPWDAIYDERVLGKFLEQFGDELHIGKENISKKKQWS